MMQRLFLFFLIVFICVNSKAQKVYEFNTTCQQAYKEITQMKLSNGIALIEKAKQQNSNNLIPILLENYVDFIVLFFNEDINEFQKRYNKFDERIELLKQGPQTSPFYNFCLGTAFLQKAGVNLKFDNKSRAGWDFQVGYRYIKQNKKSFPTFTPNEIFSGSIQAVIGSIPKGFKWVASLFGVKGNLKEGMQVVTNFINSNDPWARLMNTEATLIYCYLNFYIENKKEETIDFIQRKKIDLVNNHLLAYMTASLAMNNKQNELCKRIVLNRNKSIEYFQTPIWDFQLGYAYLHQLQIPEAIEHLKKYLDNFKGKLYVKDVYQKLSWCYYLQGNLPAAESTRKMILKKGGTVSDADNQALKDAKTNTWPDVSLLKARLLNDGGYNNEALSLLQKKNNNSFSKDIEQLEYVYRLGRIHDDLKKYDDAINYYSQAIELGKYNTAYYAARAALQIGMIKEKNGDKKSAINYYQQCLDMEDHDYKNSLDQRAKSGIARCKGE
jgi:tetratricopeptide (TPR) repeat protein